jgi:chemotaxis response regulator CheB
MESRNIIVIGASAGGFEALKKLVGGLPQDLQASLFIVMLLNHMGEHFANQNQTHLATLYFKKPAKRSTAPILSGGRS